MPKYGPFADETGYYYLPPEDIRVPAEVYPVKGLKFHFCRADVEPIALIFGW